MRNKYINTIYGVVIIQNKCVIQSGQAAWPDPPWCTAQPITKALAFVEEIAFLYALVGLGFARKQNGVLKTFLIELSLMIATILMNNELEAAQGK